MTEPVEQGVQSPSDDQAVVELGTFQEYLCRLVPVLLEDRESALPALKTAVFEKDNVESIKKFLSDSQVPVLLVQRSSTKDEAVEVSDAGEGDNDGTINYVISSDVHFTSSKIQSFISRKRCSSQYIMYMCNKCGTDNQEEVEKHLDMPPTWVEPIRISLSDFQMRCPQGKKIKLYKRAKT
ncbi:hypothetical protein ScPMuIL_014542 [Solemya velum]